MVRIITLIFMVAISVPGLGQDEEAIQKILAKTNVEELTALSGHWNVRDSLRKAEAVQKAREQGWPIRIENEEGTAELIRLDKWGKPMYYYTGNAAAATSTQTDQLHAGGGSGYNLEGSGMTIGIWDAGAVQGTHEQLSGRVSQMDGGSPFDDHATHVGGTMIGDGNPVSSAKGMAPQGTLNAYDWDNDNSEMSMAAANGLLISNHSYGFITGWYIISGVPTNTNYWFGSQFANEAYGFGLYDSSALDWDNIAYNAPFYLICKSAGNDRGSGPPPVGSTWYLNGNTDTSYIYDPVNYPNSSPEQDGGADGYDCIPYAGTAKNILTVGAVEDVTNYNGPGSVVMSSFSGWGNVDDGRIKPDIVGNGIGLYSSITGMNNKTYASYSGTSMSSPNVAGSLLLLQEHYMNTHNNTPMLAATLKGLAIHTARECGSAVGPDYEYGWGLLSVKDAADVIADDVNTDSTIAELTLNDGGTYTYVFTSDGSEPLRATICWTDVPGSSSGTTLNDPTPKLVNDLDLRISQGGTTYEPYVLNSTAPGNPATTGDNILDNVEQIYIASPVAGEYTLTVTHKGNLANPQEDFSMIVTGQNNIVLPVEFVEVSGEAKANHNRITCELFEEDLGELVLQRWNGNSFVYLKKQYSNGKPRKSEYIFIDNDLNHHIAYLYRIKAIDRDGSFEYSPLVNIVRNSTEDSFSFYPNPATDRIYFRGIEDARTLQLVNQQGKVLRQWEGLLPNSYDTQQLPSGTYYWIGDFGERVETSQLVKQ